MKTLIVLLSILSLSVFGASGPYHFPDGTETVTATNFTGNGGGLTNLSFNGNITSQTNNITWGVSNLVFPTPSGIQAIFYPTGSYTGDAPFTITHGGAGDPSNHVFSIGYNMGPNGGRLLNNQHAFGYSLEPHWSISPGLWQPEAHLKFIASDGTETRPFSFTVMTNHYWDSSIWLLHANQFNFFGGLTNNTACFTVFKDKLQFVPDDGSGFAMYLTANGFDNAAGQIEDLAFTQWRTITLMGTNNVNLLANSGAAMCQFHQAGGRGYLTLGGDYLEFGGALAGSAILHNLGGDKLRLEDGAANTSIISLEASNFVARGSGTFTNGFITVTNSAQALSSISFPASDALWTNKFGMNIVLYIDNTGVTGTTVSKNGTQIFSALVGDSTILLKPGDYFAEHYTIGTPVAKWEPN